MDTPDTRSNRGTEDLREAFANIARSSEASLLRTARRLTGRDTDWAKDLVQDALIAGYGAFRQGQFADGSNASAWLNRILTNRFINEYKRKKRWEADADIATISETQSDAFISRPAASPEANLMDSVLDEPLQRALDALPEGQRLCVVLVDVEQHNYAEAAELLNIPVGTVRSRLARARLELYKLLLP